MKNKRSLLAVIGVIFVFLAVGTTLIVNSQRQNNPDDRLQKIQQLQRIQQDVPIANFNEPFPNDVGERIKREKKSRARNIKLDPPDNPRRFMLSERRETTYGLTPNHAKVQPAIPARRSDAIIIGEVINGEAHLSEDKVSIYSEFRVRNLETFKNITPERFDTGKPIIVSRDGGGVRLPSGKVIFVLSLDKPMPKVGRIYLFFLKYSDEPEFSIITAYELTQGQVFPLDGLIPTGVVIRQYAGHQTFRGAPEANFLNQVREAVGNNSDVFIGRQGR